MKKFFKEWGSTILICLGIVFIKVGVIDTVEVDGLSMYPTFNDEDRVVIEKVTRYGNIYNYGDIIILNSHRGDKARGISDYWIKRVIGLEGDTIECKNNIIYRNGEEIKEDYIPEGIITSNIKKVVVPKGAMYVLGDNRTNSTDSRVIGSVDYDDIYGKVIYNISK